MIDTKIFIDRLTIIAYDNGQFDFYLKMSGYVNIEYSTRKTHGFRQVFKGQHGEFIELDGKGKVRIDFNPNVANMNEIGNILSFLKYPHLTRLDIAVDYFDIDFENIEWSSMKTKKRNYWTDSYGALETLYIGSRNSARQYRIYNKAMEVKEKRNVAKDGRWWRVEVQQRFKDSSFSPHEYFLSNLFDIHPYSRHGVDLSFIKNDGKKAKVLGYMACPGLLDSADKTTKSEYRKLIQEAYSRAGYALDNPPHEVYEQQKDLLADQLADLFSQCAKLTVFEEAI